MDTSAFTPGPWFVVSHPDAWTIQTRAQGAGGCIAQTYGDSTTANAHLIAAAPDLYEALRALRSALSSGVQVTQKVLPQVDAALAKARGEQ